MFGIYSSSIHYLFEILAFVVGFRVYLKLRAKSDDVISDKNRKWIIIGCAVGALVFSRFVSSLEDLQSFFNPNSFLYYYKSKTIVGGLVGGLLGVELTKKILGEKHSSGDLFVIPVIVGLIVGRVGCFLAGVYDGTVGVETQSVFGMDLGDGVMRHPTSLYEIVFLITLLLVLKQRLDLQKDKSGVVFKMFLTSYIFFRLLIEFIKPVPPLWGPFSPIQWTCILTLIYYAFDWLKGYLKNEKTLHVL